MSKYSEASFGAAGDGRRARLFTVTNEAGTSVSICDIGARIASWTIQGEHGPIETVLGFDDIAGYFGTDKYFGAICGRYANRIGGAHIKVGGVDYKLDANEGANILHGGGTGFESVQWTLARAEAERNTLVFALTSLDGDMGFPGTLDVTVTYTLGEDDSLSIDYRAMCDADTYVNLTNHAYFNLGSHTNDILTHELKLNAKYYTPISDALLPTGEIVSVAGTPFDFTSAKPIGRDIHADNEQLRYGKGYDHNFVLDGAQDGLTLAATVFCPETGLHLDASTSEPGLQVYSANHIGGFTGRGGVKYAKHGAVCLETQHYPDTPANSHFPSALLRAGDVFRSKTVYRLYR